MRTTVIVPTYNEAGNIAPLLDGISAALAPLTPFEVIVVNDASSDETARIVLDMAAGRPWLRLLSHPRPGGQSP